MRRARPAHLVAVLVVLMTVQAGVGTIARADTASDLDAARQTLADAQAAANAATEEISAAEGRFEELEGRIGALEADIERTQQRTDELVLIVRERAVSAYTNAGDTGLSSVLDASDPLDAARRTQLIDRANKKNHLATKKLAALRSDLHSQQNEVRAQRDEQQRVKDQLNVKNAALQAQLVTAGRESDDLITRLEASAAEGCRH